MINRYSKGQGNSPAPQQNWWDRLSQQSVSDAIMNQQRPQSQIPQMGEIPNTMPALQQPPTAIPNQMAQGAPMAGAPLGGAPLGEAQGGMPAPNAMAMQNANPNAAFQSPQPNAAAFQNANANAVFQSPARPEMITQAPTMPEQAPEAARTALQRRPIR